MANIIMYTKKVCPYCVAAKALLKQKGQTWTEIDIEASDSIREEMIAKSGRLTVPQIFINEKHVGGFDDLSALEQKGELDLLLKA